MGRSSVSVSMALLACAAGCLPRGDPPAGRQVIADRRAVLAGVVQAAPDGVMRVLVARPHDGDPGADLSVVSVGDGAAAPVERPLVQNIDWGLGCNIGTCLISDARGRLFLSHDFDQTTGQSNWARVDAVTGDRLELGGAALFPIPMSASGDRLVVLTFAIGGTGGSTITLYEADGRSTELPDTSGHVFVGEDLFFVAKDQGLMHWPANGAPELLHADVQSVGLQATQTGPVLLLGVSGADLQTTWWFFDPLTLQDLSAPVVSLGPAIMSPDRGWLFLYAADSQGNAQPTLIDVATGAAEAFAPPEGANTPEWRPGHAELWFQIYDYDPMTGREANTAWIKKPGAPGVAVPIFLQGLATGAFGPGSVFTRDGKYFFSFLLPPTPGNGMAMVGAADDPTGPRFDLIPQGSQFAGLWPFADGRLLTGGFLHSPQRAEIRVVDPDNGNYRTLATDGVVATAGQRRALVIQHLIDGGGDLTVIDPDGAPTSLAIEFATMVSTELQSAGADPVAPGARVAFQFQARAASPYDGIWVATIP